MGRYLFEDDWSRIDGFPDYLISTSGRILSHKRGDWRELHPDIGKNGYKYVNLRANGLTIRYYIHRLVAETFISNPYNKKAVNHIDGDKLNNDVTNLEWVTYQENAKHAYDNGLSRMPDPEISREANRTPIKAISLDTGEVLLFRSQRDAASYLNITPPHVNKVLKGECPHAKRYVFEYLNEGDEYDVDCY